NAASSVPSRPVMRMAQHLHARIMALRLDGVAARLRAGIIDGDDPTDLGADARDHVKHLRRDTVTGNDDGKVRRGAGFGFHRCTQCRDTKKLTTARQPSMTNLASHAHSSDTCAATSATRTVLTMVMVVQNAA